jgi:excisionase family DNA binding protein
VNLKTAALRLGVHYQTVYRWVRSGQLVAVKVGAGYEVSDAAVERLLAQRTATGRTPEGGTERRGYDATTNVDGALHVLDLMVDAVTLDSTAVAERAARVIAEHLGDTVFVYRGAGSGLTEPGSIAVVYAAHRDPVSEVAASTLGRDPRTSTNMVRHAIMGNELICVAQVPQRELRRRLHPELHEHLHLSGCYSAMCAPISGTGALLVTRDLPGRPYGPADVELVESIAARVTRADERASSWAGAWEMRRRMVAAFAGPSPDANCFDALVDAGGPAEPMIAVLDLELRHVACNKAYAALLGADPTTIAGVSLRSLVRDGGALDEALAPVLLGEIDYRSVELEIVADDARVALHVGMVRHVDATPRGVVLVAHPVPGLSVG